MINDTQFLKENVGSIRTKEGSKPYIGKENALTLFRHDFPIPVGRINTTMISADPPIFRAEIYINDVMVASAHASPEGNTTTFRKVEGAAIRRALEIAGYGAKQILQRIAEQISTDEAKKLLGSGGTARRLGSPEEEKPWTKAEQKKSWAYWITDLGIGQADIFAALGIKEGLSEWNKSDSSARAAITAFIEKELSGKPAAPKASPPVNGTALTYIMANLNDLAVDDVLEFKGYGQAAAREVITALTPAEPGTRLAHLRNTASSEERDLKLTSVGLYTLVGGPKLTAAQADSSRAPKQGAHHVWAGRTAVANAP